MNKNYQTIFSDIGRILSIATILAMTVSGIMYNIQSFKTYNNTIFSENRESALNKYMTFLHNMIILACF